MSKKLNLAELVNFYDYKVSSSIGHASAINAVLGEDLALVLLLHYFKSQKFEVKALAEKCNQGSKEGHRLDKWITVNSKTDSIIYQVEIKNWSAHSIGGKKVEIEHDEDYMRQYRLKRWKHQFNVNEKIPSQPQTLKVLTKMLVPTNFRSYTHKALLCFWEPMHESGQSDALFEVDVISQNFNKLTVFSMSNYVSHLLQATDTLEVEMTDANSRIDWLNKLYR